MIMDNSFDVEVEWMRQSSPRGLRGRRRGSRGSASRRRRRGALMAGDVEHMVVDADWAPHGGYQQEYGQMLHDMQVNEEEYDPSSSPSGMFVRKRERTQNWSLQEKLLLFRLVAPRLDVLENRRIDAMSSARKGRAWREIHELFSARYGPERDVFRIREQWRRMKQAAKADVAGKNPHKTSQSPAAAAVAAAVAAATSHIPTSPALAQSLMMPPTAANLAAQQQQQAVLQQQQAAVAAAAAAATATTRNQMNSVLSDMIVKALEKVREREQEGGGPFDLSELDDGMGLGGFFSSGIAGMSGGSQQPVGNQNNSQLDDSHGNISGIQQGALSDNNPSGSATSSGGSNDAWRLTIVPSQQQPTNNRANSSDNAANSQSGGEGERLLTVNKTLLTMGPKKVSDKPKASRRLLTIEQKKEIISAHEKGVRIVDLAAEYGIASSSIATILKMKEEIKAASVAAGVKTFASQRSYINEEMEKLLMVWINERWMAGDSMTQDMIQSKARMIYIDLKRKVAASKGLEEEFKGSRGWLEKFKKRSGIHIRSGEEHRANKEKVAEKFAREFQEWISMNEFQPEQVFNCDEIRLFWKKMPRIQQEEESGSKSIKERITLLLCANASGDLKIKPMIVHHSERIFKKENVFKPMLGVYCKSNTNAWVSGSLFNEWMVEVFGPTVRTYLREKGLPERAVLVLDNAPGHQSGLGEDLEFSFIKIKFLPSNTTSILQPMDQQVLSTFKKLYTKNMLQICFDATSSTSLTLKEFWKDNYHILHAIQAIAVAWDELSVRTINISWKRLLPHFCQTRNAVFCVQDAGMASEELAAEISAENNEIIDKILSLGIALDLKVSEEDVEDLVTEHSRDLTTEELEELKKQVDQEREDLLLDNEDDFVEEHSTKMNLDELQVQLKQEREDFLSENEEDIENCSKDLEAEGFGEMREQAKSQNKDDSEYLSETDDDIEEYSKDSLRDEMKEQMKVEDSSKEEGRIPMADIKKMLHHWEQFQSLATRWHPNKTEMEKLCALVGDSCLNHFKNILNKKEVSETLD